MNMAENLNCLSHFDSSIPHYKSTKYVLTEECIYGVILLQALYSSTWRTIWTARQLFLNSPIRNLKNQSQRSDMTSICRVPSFC